jgi:hypothetical protein
MADQLDKQVNELLEKLLAQCKLQNLDKPTKESIKDIVKSVVQGAKLDMSDPKSLEKLRTVMVAAIVLKTDPENKSKQVPDAEHTKNLTDLLNKSMSKRPEIAKEADVKFKNILGKSSHLEPGTKTELDSIVKLDAKGLTETLRLDTTVFPQPNAPEIKPGQTQAESNLAHLLGAKETLSDGSQVLSDTQGGSAIGYDNDRASTIGFEETGASPASLGLPKDSPGEVEAAAKADDEYKPASPLSSPFKTKPEPR